MSRPVLIVSITVTIFFAGSSAWLLVAFWASKHAFWLGAVMMFGWLAATGLFFNVYNWLDRVIPRMPRRD